MSETEISQTNPSEADGASPEETSLETQYVEFQSRTLMADDYHGDEVEATSNALADLPVDFNAGAITTYVSAGQDVEPDAFAIEDGGETLRLTGNTYKKLELPEGLVIEADTVLRVTFELVDGISSKIHAIGLDDDSSLGGGPLFQFAGKFTIAGVFTPGGTLEYPGGAVTYDIPLGEFAGQDFNFLTFINDDDLDRGSEAVFSDISFVTPSAGGGNTAPTTAPIDAGAVLESDAAVDIDLLAGAVDADGDPLTVSGVTVTDGDGANVAFVLNGDVVTIDPAQFAADLGDDEQAVVAVAYNIDDGNGGVTPNTATLTVDGEDTIPDIFVSGGDAATSFNIEVLFDSDFTDEFKAAFVDAAEEISAFITEDVPDIFAFGRVFDDISIGANLDVIDGAGGILGQAGPTFIRTSDELPFQGIMTFDIADAANLLAAGTWEDVIFHEMMHALGFGSLWDFGSRDLTVSDGADQRFVGENAMFAYNQLFEPGADIGEFNINGLNTDSNPENGVRVETDGGAGTAGAHWDETVFLQEIMTGFIGGSSFLSEVSIAAMEDLGYQTTFDETQVPSDDPLLIA